MENKPEVALQEEMVNPKFTAPSVGDVIAVTSIASKIYLNWKKSSDPSQMVPPSEEDIAKLEKIGNKFGFNVNIFAYAQELLTGLEALETDLSKSSPKEAAKKFYAKCPNIAHLLALDPKGGWKSINMFLPKSDNKKEDRTWIRQVFAALCSYVKYLKETGQISFSDIGPQLTPVNGEIIPQPNA